MTLQRSAGTGWHHGLTGRHVVIAPDKFKGSLTARQAATAMALGVKRADPALRTVECPVADGGDGTVDAAVAAGFSSRRGVRLDRHPQTGVSQCVRERSD